MTIERKFVQEGISKAQIDEFVKNELRRVGYAGMEIKKAPLGTRITIYAERPGMVIGKKGKSVKYLTKTIADDYNIENPQIEVDSVPIPELNPNIMARRIVRMLERGMHFRRSAYSVLRRVMSSGARGVEILLRGKLTGERGRHVRFKSGYIKKCGEPAKELVYHANAEANLKQGIIGVQVSIMPPHLRLPDKVNYDVDLDSLEVAEEEIGDKKSQEKSKKSKKESKEKKKKSKKSTNKGKKDVSKDKKKADIVKSSNYKEKSKFKSKKKVQSKKEDKPKPKTKKKGE